MAGSHRCLSVSRVDLLASHPVSHLRLQSPDQTPTSHSLTAFTAMGRAIALKAGFCSVVIHPILLYQSFKTPSIASVSSVSINLCLTKISPLDQATNQIEESVLSRPEATFVSCCTRRGVLCLSSEICWSPIPAQRLMATSNILSHARGHSALGSPEASLAVLGSSQLPSLSHRPHTTPSPLPLSQPERERAMTRTGIIFSFSVIG